MPPIFRKCISALKSLYTGRYAIVTNTVTAGIAGFAADLFAQGLEMRTNERSFDRDRNVNMTIINTAVGPAAYYWYRFLDGKFPGTNRKSVVKKVLTDLIVGPLFYVPYVGGLCIFKGLSFDAFVSESKNKGPILFFADMVAWPLLQACNFYFVPPHFRIVAFALNEFLLEVVFSHVLNNEYNASNIVKRLCEK